MFIIILAFITLIGSALILSGSLMGILMSGKHKISLAYSFMFVVYIIQANGIDYSIFSKLQAYIAAFTESGLFSTSNHFILSLDIISFFSTFILILYHKFKLSQILPVKQFI